MSFRYTINLNRSTTIRVASLNRDTRVSTHSTEGRQLIDGPQPAMVRQPTHISNVTILPSAYYLSATIPTAIISRIII